MTLVLKHGRHIAALLAALVMIAVPMAVSAESQGLCGGAPDTFEQSVEILQDSLRIVLSTDHVTYTLGDPVWIKLTITNLAADSTTIRSSWDPMERFDIYPDSCSSENCPQLWSDPQIVEFDGDLIPLGHDRPESRCAVWNGVSLPSENPVEPGFYRIRAGFTSVTQAHTSYDFVYPVGGLSLVIVYTDPAPVFRTRWGDLKGRWSHPRYR
ncbi:MAG TPA: hypothetical protein VFP10_11730 [Candidatus Eisenbacteria bacterium]|nr:hypothetical protein [Candidatus Eisenbacteria bacterium]